MRLYTECHLNKKLYKYIEEHDAINDVMFKAIHGGSLNAETRRTVFLIARNISDENV